MTWVFSSSTSCPPSIIRRHPSEGWGLSEIPAYAGMTFLRWNDSFALESLHDQHQPTKNNSPITFPPNPAATRHTSQPLDVHYRDSVKSQAEH